MSRVPVLGVVLGALTITDAASQTGSAIPWLHGLAGAVISNEPSDTAAQTMRRVRDEIGDPPSEDVSPCAAGRSAVLEVTADVAAAPGRETVVASIEDGVIVLDREGRLVASSPGYPCAGSADELELIATGRAGFVDPTIAIVATSGGHREQITWVGLFRVGFGGRLDATFSAVVEERADTSVRRGAVTLLPGALIYTRPAGTATLWVFDPVGGVYVRSGPLDPRERRDSPISFAPRG